MSRPARIHIAGDLAERRAPEVEWTVATLLTAIGRPWLLTTDPHAESDLVVADAPAWDTPRPDATERLRAGGGDLADAFAVLAGAAERTWPQDRHGHHHLPARDAGAPRAAVVSEFAHRLDDTLDVRLGPPPHAAWPDGKRFAAVATHDVDYPEAVRWIEPFRVVRRTGTRLHAAAGVAAGRLVHWHFDSWVDDLQPLGASSAFFFVARRGSLRRYASGTPDPFYDVRTPRFQSLLRSLHERGIEVALQPSYRACEQPGGVAAEKAALEEALGAPVAGSRHHYWRLDPEQPDETLLEHERAGLAYDCSLAFERVAGWRRGLTAPFHPWNWRLRRPVETLQLGTAWMDDHVFGHASVNGIEDESHRTALLDGLLERAAETGGVLVTDIHEYVYDDRLFPGWREAHNRLWRSLASRDDAWIATPAAVAEQWRAHETAVRSDSKGLLR